MTRRLLLSYVSLTVLVLLLLEVPLGIVFARSERRALVANLKHDALAIGVLAEETLEGDATADLGAIASDYQRRTQGRMVIVDAEGDALADSAPPVTGQRNFSGREEFRVALSGREATGTRRSETLGTDLFYVAVPVASQGEVLGAVRITYTPTAMNAVIRRNWLVLGIVGTFVLIAVWALSFVIARSVSRPVRRLQEAAHRLAQGDLAARATVDRGAPGEIHTLTETLNSMAERIQDLVRSQQDFVADASHQLRTPLQALRLRLENLHSVLKPSDRSELEAALGEVARLGRIVEGLLALARVEGHTSRRTRIDATTVAAQRAGAWAALAAEKDISIAVKGTEAHEVLVTPGHLEQALDNLISNAIDASPSGGAVRIDVSSSNEQVEVHVMDEGPGLSEVERKRALDRFWRSPSNPAKGSGLGLTIAERLIRCDGGALELREGPGGGVDAVVRLESSRIRSDPSTEPLKASVPAADTR